jgi:hypothetical protein
VNQLESRKPQGGVLQDGHRRHEPELLLFQNMNTTRLESLVLRIERVAENNENPRSDQPDPADEPMVSLKDTGILSEIVLSSGR